MSKLLKVTISLSLLCGFCVAVPAQSLISVATVGKTQPLFKQQSVPDAPNKAQVVDMVKATINQRYFVKSKLLSPGHVIEEAKPLKVPTPIAIVGCDRASYVWLRTYRTRLKTLGATAYVVNCNGKEQYQKLSQASAIPLVPTVGDDFARQFSINHYPVLLTRGGIFQ